MEKIINDLNYELNNRPDWVRVPLRVLRLILMCCNRMSKGYKLLSTLAITAETTFDYTNYNIASYSNHLPFYVGRSNKQTRKRRGCDSTQKKY